MIVNDCNGFLFKFKGSILDMAKSLPFPLPLLAVAHQQLISGTTLNALHIP